MRERAATHERLTSPAEIQTGSARSFGLVFACAFAIVGLGPLARGGPVRWWAVLTAGGLLALAAIRPHTLTPLNRLWTRLGLWLHAALSPVVLAFLFYGTVTPIGLALRLLGKDALRRGLERHAPTYWLPRDTPTPTPDSLRHQF